MHKFTISTVGVALAIASFAAAAGNTATPRVDQREANQQARIDAGVASGQLTARELAGWLAADANRARGEFVLVLHASRSAPPEGESVHDTLLVPLLAALPLKQAVAVAAEIAGAPRNALYARALALRGARDDG